MHDYAVYIYYILLYYDCLVYIVYTNYNQLVSVLVCHFVKVITALLYILMLNIIMISLSYIYFVVCCTLFTHVQSKVCINY